MAQLHRSSTNSVFFGVCGGLAERYRWDPTWVRLAFILGTLLGGPGVLVYVVMALVMPKHRSLGAWQPRALR